MPSTILRYLIVATAWGLSASAAKAQTEWTVRGGTTELFFHVEALERLGLTVREHGGALSDQTATRFVLPISASSDLIVTENRGEPADFVSGHIVLLDGLTLQIAGSIQPLETLAFLPAVDQESGGFVMQAENGRPALLSGKVKVALDDRHQQLLIEGASVAISPELADGLKRPELAGEIIASVQMIANLAWSGGDDPRATDDGTPVAAGNTECSRPGGADVIVGDLSDILNFTAVGGIEAFAVGTTSCNVGSVNLNWYAHTNQHPVIGQSMFRLKNGRFEQVGMSWLKHGFNALKQNLCECGCNGDGGTVLGVGCSDPYEAFLNGDQNRLGPRFQVNPATGYFEYPYAFQGQTGNSIYKRLQVKIGDLDPALAGGGQYFVEGQYVTPDDAAAGNQANNASYRPVTITGGGSAWSANVSGTTVRELPAIRAWEAADEAVETVDVFVPSDGLVIVAGKAMPRGGSTWEYEYAVQNLYSDRAVGAFTVAVGIGANVTSIGFHDVDYHSGEPYDGTDWSGAYDGQYITWSSVSFDINSNANALRWGTLYNFRFECNQPPTASTLTLGLFKPGTPDSVTVDIVGPAAALLCTTAFGDGDGDCDADLADYAMLQKCFVGSGGTYPAGCACFDADMDGDIDLADVDLLGSTWTGPNEAVGGCVPP